MAKKIKLIVDDKEPSLEEPIAKVKAITLGLSPGKVEKLIREKGASWNGNSSSSTPAGEPAEQ